MKHKTWFRLMLKVLGVFFAVGSVTDFLGLMASFTYYIQQNVPRGQWWYLIASLITPLVKIAVGAYLFFDGKVIADLAIPGNRPYCHECGYDLTGAVGHTCNECGTPLRAAETNP